MLKADIFARATFFNEELMNLKYEKLENRSYPLPSWQKNKQIAFQFVNENH